MKRAIIIATLILVGFGCLPFGREAKPPAKRFQGPSDYVSPTTPPPGSSTNGLDYEGLGNSENRTVDLTNPPDESDIPPEGISPNDFELPVPEPPPKLKPWWRFW